MARSPSSSGTQRSDRDNSSPRPAPRPLAKPRWAFWKGLLTGAIVEVPAIALTVWVLSRLGVGDPDVRLMHLVRLTTMFCGIAALFTAGGIGRLAAYATVEGGRRRAMFVAARAHAVAMGGLVMIAAIPHGDLPEHWQGWLVYPLAGLVGGAVNGLIIGAVCSGTTSVGLAEVWSLAKRPSEALKTILDPDDFVRLGAALRSRTSTLFDGIFEPAAPPPKPDEDKPPPPAKPEPTTEATPPGEPR